MFSNYVHISNDIPFLKQDNGLVAICILTFCFVSLTFDKNDCVHINIKRALEWFYDGCKQKQLLFVWLMSGESGLQPRRDPNIINILVINISSSNT